jgi:hypothetical protein
MTVKELIETLETLDPDLHILVHGYEGGFHFVDSPGEETTFCLDVYSEWYYGPHEKIESVVEESRPNYKQIKGIVL